MGITANVLNGELQQKTTQTKNNSSINTESKKKAQGMGDEDMFLSLLVAEMQYQDPLEPTSNTEYVSELATFTQVSSLQEMNATMSDMGAQSLVGQYVTIMDEDGAEFTGQVDYTTEQDGEVMVSIGDELYKASLVRDVINSNYYEAGMEANTFSSMVSKLPDAANLTLDEMEDVMAAQDLLSSFSDYTLKFVSEDDTLKLQSLISRLNSLSKSADE